MSLDPKTAREKAPGAGGKAKDFKEKPRNFSSNKHYILC